MSSQTQKAVELFASSEEAGAALRDAVADVPAFADVLRVVEVEISADTPF